MGELAIQQIEKSFGANKVVDRISFRVPDGEFFVLLGPSGGGKSTLLRVICGLEQPDSGAVIINGVNVTAMSPRQRNIGMVFQDYGLYPTMDTAGNIAYGLEARGMPAAEVRKRVQSAAEMLGLTPLLHRNIVDLSGGEQQRVALARALAKDADVFLFDEPLSNLDPKLRHQARRDILAVHRTKGKPSVYVTHDQTEAFTMGDRIAVVAHGKLQQIGSADDLLQRPANLYIARFIGAPPMNLLNGRVTRQGERYVARVAGVEAPLPARWNATLGAYNRPEVTLGVRPEAVIPEQEFGALDEPPQAVFDATIEDLEPLVGETHVTLAPVGARDASRLVAVFQERDDETLEPGQRIRVGLDTQRLSLFDPHTEQALTPA